MDKEIPYDVGAHNLKKAKNFGVQYSHLLLFDAQVGDALRQFASLQEMLLYFYFLHFYPREMQ